MTKITKKAYLEVKDDKNLKEKMRILGFEGRGSFTKFIEKLAREEIVILDENLKKMLKVLMPLIQ